MAARTRIARTLAGAALAVTGLLVPAGGTASAAETGSACPTVVLVTTGAVNTLHITISSCLGAAAPEWSVFTAVLHRRGGSFGARALTGFPAGGWRGAKTQNLDVPAGTYYITETDITYAPGSVVLDKFGPFDSSDILVVGSNATPAPTTSPTPKVTPAPTTATPRSTSPGATRTRAPAASSTTPGPVTSADASADPSTPASVTPSITANANAGTGPSDAPTASASQSASDSPSASPTPPGAVTALHDLDGDGINPVELVIGLAIAAVVVLGLALFAAWFRRRRRRQLPLGRRSVGIHSIDPTGRRCPTPTLDGPKI